MIHLISHPEFYESFDRYQPNEDDFLEVVKKIVPSDWKFHRNNYWFGVEISDNGNGKRSIPFQGWKIHISSSVSNAADILKAVVPILVKDRVVFKFSLDQRILKLMNSKRFGRQGAGKFITIYPFDDEYFKILIEKLHQATKSFEGSYILSDKRYKDSKVVFYRYGGFVNSLNINVNGNKDHNIFSPDGTEVSDQRVPYFRVPEWAKDPFEEGQSSSSNPEEDDTSSLTLKDGRYIIKAALAHSNAGGVYVAEDTTTSEEVVIKEARPHVYAIDNSVKLLQKEYRLLKKLADTGFVPKPIDFFRDWEHTFMVTEKLTGVTLANYRVQQSVSTKVNPTLDDTQTFYNIFQKVFLQFARYLKTIHERNIVFTDISPNNVIINPETLKVTLIDLEGSYEIGVDNSVHLFTPGFMAPGQAMGEEANFQSDWFGFGATMHNFLASINQLFALNPKIRYTYIKSVIEDIGFPEEIYHLIMGLLEKNPEDRPTYEKIVQTLEKDVTLREPEIRVDKESVKKEAELILAPICNYILSKADFSRTDRLFPADKEIFSTNPLSLAHGAVGIACSIKKIQQNVPEEVVEWIVARNKNPLLYPTGLYVGLSGIAWGMLELGLVSESKSVLQSTFEHPLLYKAANLGYGISGWGLTNLKFFHQLQDEVFLQKAIEAGKYIIDNISENEEGCFWDEEKTGENIHLGYLLGGSGISLFLLYLYLASRKEEFLDTGKKILDFELNNSSLNTEGGRSWKKIVGQGRIVYPYFGEGSAGVGKAVIRYHRLLNEEKYVEALDDIFIDCNRKYSIWTGLISGLTGLGDFNLDLYRLTKDQKHLDGAYRTASGALLCKIEKEEGIAYAGNGLERISCDYATGSAGVGRFFHRLLNVEESTDFLLDDLFEDHSSEAKANKSKTGIA